MAIVFLVYIGKVTISNDGATIMNLLDIVHPAGKTLVDIAKSQDAEVCALSRRPANKHARTIPVPLVYDCSM